ncbi:MAG: pirin family protein [Armatimonadetes bacterium]|nr:pirin family protein [Armatimonadota bacterium]
MKRILSVHRAPEKHWVGDGFPVRTVLHSKMDGASPFLLLDYAEPIRFEPSDKPRGVEEHPHRGFETVTIVFQGELEHRDSAGNHGKIGPGDVQWMTAASGVVHEEKHGTEFTRNGGTFEVAQLWVNLPAAHKISPPAYQELKNENIPVVEMPGGGSARVIAGDFNGTMGPARTVIPVFLWDVSVRAGSRLDLPDPSGSSAIVFIRSGSVRLNDTEEAGALELAVFAVDGEGVAVEALEDSKLLVLGGEPIDEPVVAHGPFVMNTFEEIRQAVADYQNGVMGTLAAR